MTYLHNPEKLGARQQRDATFNADPDRIDMLQRLRTATPAQIDSYIDGNVTSLPQARAYLKKLTKVVALLVGDA